MATTNINGANQFHLDPRQLRCWANYIDPRSKTFGNGMQSAIEAGYEPLYANQITTVEWFKDRIRRLGMLGKAERNLEKIMDTGWENGKDGAIQPDVMRIVADVSKTVAKSLGKDEGWSDRTETAVVPDSQTSEKIDGLGKDIEEIRASFEAALKAKING